MLQWMPRTAENELFVGAYKLSIQLKRLNRGVVDLGLRSMFRAFSLFLSPFGRIDRWPYLLALIANLPFVWGAGILIGNEHRALAFSGAGIFALTTHVVWCLMAKRLRTVGQTAWLSVVPFLFVASYYALQGLAAGMSWSSSSALVEYGLAFDGLLDAVEHAVPLFVLLPVFYLAIVEEAHTEQIPDSELVDQD